MWQIDARQLVAKFGTVTAINDRLRYCKYWNNKDIKQFYNQ